MPTPRCVDRADMLAAIEPLCSLLDVDAKLVYSLHITGTSIELTMSPEGPKRLANKPVGPGDSAGTFAHHYTVGID